MSRRSLHAMWTRRCNRNRLPLTDDPRRIAERNSVIWYVPCHDRSGPYEGVFSDRNPWINDALCTDRCEALHRVSRSFHSPWAFGYLSLVNVTLGPMNTLSSIVTPVGMKTKGRILQLSPIVTPSSR